MNISSQLKTFTYLGGKFSILPFIYQNFPKEYSHFVDVTGGSMSVLLNKPTVSEIETYNDINSRVVNFFKVLRDNPFELIHQLYFTPHSREEYNDAWFSDGVSDLENARRFFIRTQQSIFAAGAQNQKKGWAASTKESRCDISEKTSKWINAVEGLGAVVERIRRVQIECKDFRYILKHYDHPETFFYFDGPYLQTHRSSTKYEFEFGKQDYIDLSDISKKLKGKILISHYEDPYIDPLFPIDQGFFKSVGPSRKNNLSEKVAIECVWRNYSP